MRKFMLFNIVALALSLNSWAVDTTPRKSVLKDLFKSGQEINDEEKIEETKKLALSPAEAARQIRVVLESYNEPGPTKVIANDICSPQGPKFNAYFKNEVFSFSEIQDPTAKNTHTTQIRYKKSIAKEKEDFVQVGTSRVTRTGTKSYAINDGEKETSLGDIRTSIRMIDQFVNTQVMTQIDGKSALRKSDHALLTTELEQAFKFFKEKVGACCAINECKTALKAQISISTKLNNHPSSASPASAGAH